MNRLTGRLSILTVTLCLCGLGLSAQQIGLQGGLSLPDLRGNADQEQTFLARQDAFFGFFTSFRLTNLLSLQTGLDYCGEGGKSSGIQQVPMGTLKNYPPVDTLYANYGSNTILRYMEVPVEARLTWGQRVKYFLEGGIFGEYLISAQLVTQGKGILYTDPLGQNPARMPPGSGPFSPNLLDGSSNIYRRVNTINVGLLGGGGVSYAIGRNQFYLDLRITEGMMGINRDEQEYGKYKTGNFIVAFGYGFRIGK